MKYNHHNPGHMMSLEEAKEKLCEQARLLEEPCDPDLLNGLYHTSHSSHQQEFLAQQSKNAVIYVMVVVVFYVAVVVLLVGTNLKTGRWKKKGAKFKKHVVEFEEGEGATNKIVSAPNVKEHRDTAKVVEV